MLIAERLSRVVHVRGLPMVALIALFSGPGAGQPITGRVTNQQGDPVGGVLLRWIDPQGQTTSVFCDAAGFYQVDLGFLTLIEGDRSSVPGSFLLEPNYPNPFNPGTTIPFRIGSPMAAVAEGPARSRSRRRPSP